MVTDSSGRKVDFKNTIIIMTSNAGAENIVSPKNLGFNTSKDPEQDYKNMKNKVMDEVKRIFKPEFLNRIDEMIVFHMLTKENVARIVDIMMNSINKRITISFLILFFLALVVKRCGRIDNAISLKAIVAPWNNSRKYAPSALTSGAISSVSNLLSYALLIQFLSSSSVKSVRKRLITSYAVSW